MTGTLVTISRAINTLEAPFVSGARAEPDLRVRFDAIAAVLRNLRADSFPSVATGVGRYRTGGWEGRFVTQEWDTPDPGPPVCWEDGGPTTYINGVTGEVTVTPAPADWIDAEG